MKARLTGDASREVYEYCLSERASMLHACTCRQAMLRSSQVYISLSLWYIYLVASAQIAQNASLFHPALDVRGINFGCASVRRIRCTHGDLV